MYSLATTYSISDTREDRFHSLDRLVSRHREPEAPVHGPHLVHQVAVDHRLEHLVGGTREVLRGGVLLGPNGLVCFQGGRDVLPLAAEKGQPGGLVGELYDNGCLETSRSRE